jgi:hypothetical protein
MTKSYRRRNRIAGQFAPRTIDMLRSPAYRALSRGGHQVLARIEIELADHGGMDNGKLPVTFDQFEAYGVHRHAIAPAVRELVALGFIEVTEQGRAGNADWRRPTKFRITYRYVERANPTDEWRRITEDDACSISPEMRGTWKTVCPGQKNRKPVTESAPQVSAESVPKSPVFIVRKPSLQAIVRKPSLLSILSGWWWGLRREVWCRSKGRLQPRMAVVPQQCPTLGLIWKYPRACGDKLSFGVRVGDRARAAAAGLLLIWLCRFVRTGTATCAGSRGRFADICLLSVA